MLIVGGGDHIIVLDILNLDVLQGDGLSEELFIFIPFHFLLGPLSIRVCGCW